MTTLEQKSCSSAITNKSNYYLNSNLLVGERRTLIIIIQNSSLRSLPAILQLFLLLLILLFIQQHPEESFMASALVRTVVSSVATTTTTAAATTTATRSRTIMEPIIAQEINLRCSDGIRFAGQSYITPNLLVPNNDAKINTNQQQQPVVINGTNDATTSATNNIQLRYQPHHRILCLHGWMDNCRSFHYLAPALIKHYTQKSLLSLSSNDNNNATESSDASFSSTDSCQVVAIDFPGHGLSSHKSMDSPPALLAESIFYVNEALHQLQWDHETKPFTLIGHSMGAAISCLYAAAFPEQINKLILLEGVGPFARNGNDVGKHVRQHVLRRRLGLEQNKSPRIYPSLDKAVETRQLTATNFPGKQYLSKAGAYEMVLRGTKPVNDGSGGVQFIHDPRLQWPSIQYFTKEQVEGLYHDIQCPTALLIAEDGWPFDKDGLQRTLEILKPTIVHKLPGSHHFHTDPDTAERVAHEVIHFLSS